jgi:hypothetical protein
VTLYEAENASGLAKGQPFPSLGSRDEPAANATARQPFRDKSQALPDLERNPGALRAESGEDELSEATASH